MPHYRFFIDTPLYANEKNFIEGSEYHHMVKVMRLSKGDAIELINGLGYLAKATLTHLDKEKATYHIQEVFFQEKPTHPFIIVQAILKPTSLELTVEKNTELGMDSMWIFPAFHSEKKSLSDNQLERLHKHTLSALKQCGRLYLPELRIFTSLEEVVSSPNIQILYGDLSTSAIPLSQIKRDPKKTILFVVGPEQGFHEKEVALLKQYQGQGVSLHPNILRAETASIAASVILSLG